MANRPELQNKGQGRRKNPTTGQSMGPGTSHKGISRVIQENKRAEAEERDRRNKRPDSRRAFWRARGFNRKSHAANVVRATVAEANEIADDIREKAGGVDWRPVV